MNDNTTNSRERFIKTLIDKISHEIREENQKQIMELKTAILENINDKFIMQNRPHYYDNHNGNSEYSYQEEIEHKNFEHFLKTGERIDNFGQKSLQGTPIVDGPLTDYTSGADLVSSILQKDIIKLLSRENVIRKLARVKMVSGDKTEYLQVLDKIDELGWVSEIESRDRETKTPRINRLVVKLCEMYALPKISRNLLLNDSTIDVASWLKEEISDAFAKTELVAFLRGDGNLKPLGILHNNAGIDKILTKTKEVVEFQDLLNLYNSLDFQYREGACFLMSPRMQGKIYGLKDPNGNSVLQHSFKEAFPSTLFGYPIYLTDYLDSGESTGHLPIIFGNFKTAYLIIDCNLNTFMRDEVTEKQWVKFYTTKRVGGVVVNKNALKIFQIK